MDRRNISFHNSKEIFMNHTLFLSPTVRFVEPGAGGLPPSWWQLRKEGFHPDLVLRAQRFCDFAAYDGCLPGAHMALDILATGFRRTAEFPEVLPDDPHVRLKRNYRDALLTLASDFGNRISAVAWESVASLGLRPNPEQEATIFSQRDHLPYPWWLIDAILHSLSKVYVFFLHIQTRINERTGMVLHHNCDCNHMVAPLPSGQLIRCPIPARLVEEATAAFFTHLLIEVWVIGIKGLPTIFGLSPEGEELKREFERELRTA
jgi:hypothetical protein